MDIERIAHQNRKLINAFIQQHWFTLQMVVHGEVMDLGTADGWYATEQQEIIGLITYLICGTEMEILSLDSLCENQGIGTALLNQAVLEARRQHCDRIRLITTNDNTNALRFYQKRGFDMVKLYRNALDESRKLKPEIPLFGNDGIPLKHEIEFEMRL